MPPSPAILERILAFKRSEIEEVKRQLPLGDVKAQMADAPPPRDFIAALRDGPAPRPRVIAEIKRRSPSVGDIRPHVNAVEVAQGYMLGGAAALSVLTDLEFFGGSLIDLVAVRAGTRLPVLRKDFIIDPYMIYRARAAGADAVLLIARALPEGQLADLLDLTHSLGMAALVEVHSEAELSRALEADARLVGVNHRDLQTFEIDLGLSARLRPLAPKDIVFVAESGIRTGADLRRLREAGCDAALVGETLMRAPDPGQALRELIQSCL